MENVSSYKSFLNKSSGKERSFLLLYKPGGEQSNCAFEKLEKAIENSDSTPVYTANVTEVHDIHERYGISSVPSLLIFNKGEYINNVKGCQPSDYYKAIFENTVFYSKSTKESKPVKRVTVYSTPSCSWCNTLKSWLRNNSITFNDIDVSRDQKAAEELVERTGQQGVPQTDINGQVVVGFDQPRLKELLEIQ